MAISWAKATHGGSDKKGGGGKLDTPTTKGNKGQYGSAPKSNPASGPTINTPTTKGNKGVTTNAGFPSSKAIKD